MASRSAIGAPETSVRQPRRAATSNPRHRAVACPQGCAHAAVRCVAVYLSIGVDLWLIEEADFRRTELIKQPERVEVRASLDRLLGSGAASGKSSVPWVIAGRQWSIGALEWLGD